MKNSEITTLLEQVSNRKYKAVWWEGNVITEEFTLKDKIDRNTAYEWQYSVLENADEIFGLKVGETMYFRGERDDENSKGFIVRIK